MFRIAFGLTCIMLSSLFAAQALGLVPDRHAAVLEGRKQLCETLALECSQAVSRHEETRLKVFLLAVHKRNKDIASAGLRLTDGSLVLEVGDHQGHWAENGQFPSATGSCAVSLSTPDGPWGQLEVCFRQEAPGLLSWAQDPFLCLMLFLAGAVFASVFLYLRLVLRHAEAGKVVPDRVRAALNTITEGVLILDKKQRIALANDAFAEKIGRRPEELAGMAVANLPWLRSGKVTAPDCYPWEKTFDKKSTEIGQVLTLHTDEAGPRKLSINSTPILSDGGDCRGVLATFDDLTPLENRNAQLRRAMSKLKVSREKIRHQKKDLEVAKTAAETANQSKTEFLANVSHEIRTPMNTIIGMTDIALEMGLPAEHRECFELVKVAADSLLGMINDLLDLSKIEAGKFTIETVDFSLQDSLSNILKLLAVKAHSKGLELVCDLGHNIPDRLRGDPTRLNQILMNLISNAIKFTDKGEILLGIEKCQVDLETGQIKLHFRVADTGIGIPAARQKSIFESFVQADSSTTRRFGGTGLGLTICSQLVEMMGGELWVESEFGRGSVFHFQLCYGTTPELPEGRPVSCAEQGRVLVVEDHPTSLRVALGLLGRLAFDAVGAESGQAALAALEAAELEGYPFGLVLVDAQLPDMDGFRLAQRAKSQSTSAPAILMMLSSNDKNGQMARCRELGIKSFISKPVTGPEIVRGLQRAVGLEISTEPEMTSRSNSGASWTNTRCGLRVLVVDDNAFNQKVITTKLERRGHQVAIAGCGQEALAAFTDFSEGFFDLILMDMQMPDMNGAEATRRIRTLEGATGKRTPVIALTAHAFEEIRDECLEAGMDGYVVKPIQDEKLWQAIGAVCPAFKLEETLPEFLSLAEANPCLLDWQTLLERAGGSEQLLTDLFKVFRDDSVNLVAELREAIDKNVPVQVRNAAHTLKGMLGFFEVTNMVEKARQLEQMGKAGTLAGAAELFEELLEEIGTLDEALVKLESASVTTLRSSEEALEKVI